MKEFIPRNLPLNLEFSSSLYQKLIVASRTLATLNGYAKTIPNQEILINALLLQEAKDSSEIENIITTHNDLYLSKTENKAINKNVKEVENYEKALKIGYKLIKEDGLLLNRHILQIQKKLENNEAGFRKQGGTTLKNAQTGEIKHIPPQNPKDIVRLMNNLEQYINNDSLENIDPLIKMAIIHYQFETIHPFYDGNGRTGRIINILYLVYKGLLDLPILYLSEYIVQNKARYYELIQKVRDEDSFEEWIEYILEGVAKISNNTIALINAMQEQMQNVVNSLQSNAPKIYSKELVESLFIYPYTKQDSIKEHLGISRQTASKYLNTCVDLGILNEIRIGTKAYYVNTKLCDLFRKKV